jgi:hypothetical protein
MQPHPATTASAVVDTAMRQVDRESERHTQRSCRPRASNGSDASGSKVAGRCCATVLGTHRVPTYRPTCRCEVTGSPLLTGARWLRADQADGS